jgi:hypothetical protein
MPYKNTFKFKDDSTLTLKNIKVFRSGSEETFCFTSSLYYNNKLLATISNHGHGGSNNESITNHTLFEQIEKRLIEEHPKYLCEWDNVYRSMSLETWINEAINESEIYKDYIKDIRSKVIFIDDKNKLQFIGFKKCRNIRDIHLDYIKKNYKNSKILNTLHKEKAFKIFYSYVMDENIEAIKELSNQ